MFNLHKLAVLVVLALAAYAPAASAFYHGDSYATPYATPASQPSTQSTPAESDATPAGQDNAEMNVLNSPDVPDTGGGQPLMNIFLVIIAAVLTTIGFSHALRRQ